MLYHIHCSMLVIIAVSFVLACLIWSLTGRRKGLPPGPPCFPIIGNVGLFKPSESLQAHRKLRTIYGDIYSVMIFHKPMIAVHGFHHIRQLLVKHGDVLSDRPKVFASEVLAKRKGLVWSSGSLWKEQRTFALTTMRKFGFGRRCMESQIMEEVDCFMKELEKYESKAFDIRVLLNTTVSNVICSLIFGKRFDYEDAKFKRLMFLLKKLVDSVNISSPAFIFPWLHKYRICTLDTAEESVNALLVFVTEMIEEHRRTFDEDNIADYIDAYLLEQKQKPELDTTFTDEQLKHNVLDFFSAGTETTSTLLLWALLYLLHHQEWQKNLQEDIDNVIGSGQPKMEHERKLPRVEAFILEIQRVANILPLNLPHATNEDFIYNGYIFPKDAIVFCVLDSVLSDPEIYSEPSQFKPERFLDDNGKCFGETKDKLISFSLGRRQCLGLSLAKMELFLFLTRLLQSFEVKPERLDCLPPLNGIFGIMNLPQAFNLRMIKRS